MKNKKTTKKTLNKNFKKEHVGIKLILLKMRKLKKSYAITKNENYSDANRENNILKNIVGKQNIAKSCDKSSQAIKNRLY